MSRTATPATRNEATRRLEPSKVTPFARHRHGHSDLARTVANGCDRKRHVERRHPQPPDLHSETGTLATHSDHSGKINQCNTNSKMSIILFRFWSSKDATVRGQQFGTDWRFLSQQTISGLCEASSARLSSVLGACRFGGRLQLWKKSVTATQTARWVSSSSISQAAKMPLYVDDNSEFTDAFSASSRSQRRASASLARFSSMSAAWRFGSRLQLWKNSVIATQTARWASSASTSEAAKMRLYALNNSSPSDAFCFCARRRSHRCASAFSARCPSV